MENQRSSVTILPPTSCGSRLSYCSESCEAEVGQGTSLHIVLHIVFTVFRYTGLAAYSVACMHISCAPVSYPYFCTSAVINLDGRAKKKRTQASEMR